MQAWLSSNKHMLTEGLASEHTASFVGVAPNLGDLRWQFWAITQVLERYELFRVFLRN